MDQNQDELQAAINDITSGGADDSSASAADDIVAQLTNQAQVAVAAPEEVTTYETPQAEAAGVTVEEGNGKIEITPQKAMYGDPDLDRVKSNALNEIRPILETVEIPFEKKFMIYKDIIELTDDKACIEPAFNAARQITDEKTRAESLLYIIEIIDELGIKMPKK